ncbi:MAG: hypothetical protein K0U93_26820 [Gammaproteobacteria bacterium]|nr:hypothetical protein [Gammaproteobacteria bacterium]
MSKPESEVSASPLRPVSVSSETTGQADPNAEVRRGVESLELRIKRVERQNHWMKLALLFIGAVTIYYVVTGLLPQSSIVQKTLMESRELKLIDKDGQPRLFLRMYSRVPVLQLLDASGKPRMSLGLRFDDTPFLDLSDKTGRTRATLEMTTDDEPKLELFDESGDTTFRIK